MENDMDYAVIAITKRGGMLGMRIRDRLNGSMLFLPTKLRGGDWEGAFFFDDLDKKVGELFYRCRGLVFIMATGIVVRLIAHLLRGKDKDPAVVVIDEKGRHVISLLSGHLGGANRLAMEIADIIGGEPVITTATEINELPCIEDIASAIDCVIEDIASIKYINSAILEGGRVVFISDDRPRLMYIKDYLKGYSGSSDIDAMEFVHHDPIPSIHGVKGNPSVIITHYTIDNIPPYTLILRPKDLVVGIGCDRGVSVEEVEEAYNEGLRGWNLSPLSVKGLASIDIKSDEEGLIAFAKKHGLEIGFYTRDELSSLPLPSGPSRFVMERIGIGGVCEPAAMRAAGVRDVLFKKKKIGRVTLSVSVVPFVFKR